MGSAPKALPAPPFCPVGPGGELGGSSGRLGHAQSYFQQQMAKTSTKRKADFIANNVIVSRRKRVHCTAATSAHFRFALRTLQFLKMIFKIVFLKGWVGIHGGCKPVFNVSIAKHRHSSLTQLPSHSLPILLVNHACARSLS